MKMRYQRDLYRVQLCCDTDKEESAFGYPLQMCLRNSITGLLPCHGQNTDGTFSICWDVTSRYNVTQIVGEGKLSPALLLRILEALLQTMENMEKFLIPCEYLALDPGCIYLESEGETVSFLCDFENRDSFRMTLPLFGEYVLEHMDHRDPEAMRLGYGLYRLAVEDTFDREGFLSLLQKPQAETGQQTAKPYQEGEARRLYTEDRLTEYDREKGTGQAPEDTDEQRARREALRSFFTEEEEEQRSILPPKKIIVLCVTAVILGTLVMEGVIYFRNGRHLAPGWLVIGAVLLVLSFAALTVMEICCRLKETRQAESDHREKKNDQKNCLPGEAYRRPVSFGKDVSPVIPSGKEEELSEATVVLSRRQIPGYESAASLCCEDGREFRLKGDHCLIGKKRSQVDVCLERDTVSRLHARIYCRNGTYYIEDLNSRNGTCLNGHVLDGGTPEILSDGAEIMFADFRCTFLQPDNRAGPEQVLSKNTVIYVD